jgi:hypothetical protein
LTENLRAQRFRQRKQLFFSADLCYNGLGDENGEQKRIAAKKKIAIAKF